jgi:hypothetical protein
MKFLKDLCSAVLAVSCVMAFVSCQTVPIPKSQDSVLLVLKVNRVGSASGMGSVGYFFNFDNGQKIAVGNAAGYRFITELSPGEHELSHVIAYSNDFIGDKEHRNPVGFKFKLEPGKPLIFPYALTITTELSGGYITNNWNIVALTKPQLDAIAEDLKDYDNYKLWVR